MILMACLVTISLVNFRYPGMPFVAAGIVSNMAAILANGSMPVSVKAIEQLGGLTTAVIRHLVLDPMHEPLTSSSSLKFLCDVIPVPGPSWSRGVVSVGDLVLLVGAALLVSRYIKDA